VGARLGPIGSPQLETVDPIVRQEVHRPAGHDVLPEKVVARRCCPYRERALRASMNVLQHPGAGLGPVAPPQLEAVDAVVGEEDHCAGDFDEGLVQEILHMVVEGAAPSRVDVLHEEGPRLGAVGPPELHSRMRRSGLKEGDGPSC
jgi:hypothetical protein